ncbi:MAG: hypothetical protein ACK56I_20375, partial [bacterium]
SSWNIFRSQGDVGGQLLQDLLQFVDGRQVLVRDAFASPEAALVRSHLVVAALVSNDELPGHLDSWFPVVPVKGVEDVLILC